MTISLFFHLNSLFICLLYILTYIKDRNDLHCFIVFYKSVIKMQFLLSNLQFVYTVNKNDEYDKEVHE